MDDRPTPPCVAPTGSSSQPTAQPALHRSRKRDAANSFGYIDPLTQTRHWPRIKRERERNAAKVEDLNGQLNRCKETCRALRKRCRRLEADGGAGDAIRARHMLRKLLGTMPTNKPTTETTADWTGARTVVLEVLGVLGDRVPAS